MSAHIVHEALCAECGKWSEITTDAIGWWWKDSPGCPKCGRLVLVESECETRHRPLKAWKVGDDALGYLVFAAPDRLHARKMMASYIGENDEDWDWMYLRALRCPKADQLAVKEGEIHLSRDLWLELFGDVDYEEGAG